MVSIDPGKDGGIATFIGTKMKDAISMPTVRVCVKDKLEQLDLDGKGKKQFIKSGPNKGKPKMKLRSPAKHVTKLDMHMIACMMSKSDIVVIEQQSCRPGNGSKQCAETMTNYGRLLGAAEALGKNVYIVSPSKWKTDMHLTMTKDEKKALGGDSKMITDTLKAKAISHAKFLLKEHTELFVTDRGRLLDGVAEAALIGSWFIGKNRDV